jgi:hypothetical protein
MLSKTAMALVPAASLVGAAALASTTSLAKSVENHGFIAVNYPYCQEKRLGQKVSGDFPAHSRAKERSYGERFPDRASSSLQKKLNRIG